MKWLCNLLQQCTKHKSEKEILKYRPEKDSFGEVEFGNDFIRADENNISITKWESVAIVVFEKDGLVEKIIEADWRNSI